MPLGTSLPCAISKSKAMLLGGSEPVLTGPICESSLFAAILMIFEKGKYLYARAKISAGRVLV